MNALAPAAAAAPRTHRRGAGRVRGGDLRLAAARGGPASGSDGATPQPLSLLPPRSSSAPLWELSAGKSAPARTTAVASLPAASAVAPLLTPNNALMAGGALAAALAAKAVFGKPARAYQPGSVGREYDAWTREGILEYYWGEHIHLGYYTDEERAAGYKKKDFKGAKFDFTDKMLEFSGVGAAPAKVLDVGCGIGGTTRHLAKRFGPSTQLTGITLSPNQVRRATELASAAGLQNCEFRVMDALNMDFPDNTFDFVWACESGEHMPDKKKYVEEMVRVLKPGGKIVIATWCQREATPEKPITPMEQKELRFLYEEWSHPYFVSIEEYVRMLEGTGACATVESDDWARYTIPAWRHSVWVGVYDPWPVVVRPHLWYKTIRDIVCLEKMHQAFEKGLMTYGMMRATKAGPTAAATAAASTAAAATK